MNYLRKITVGVACGLLPFILFGLGLSYSLYQVVGKPDRIKTALSQSGVYDTAASSFVDALQKDAEKQPDAGGVSASHELPVEQAKVKEAIAGAFPATNLKMHADGLIENLYLWVQGETTDLRLTLDLAENQASLLANLEHQAKERAANLPRCEKPPTEEVDIFRATCLPTGITPDMAAEKLMTELRQGEFFTQQSIDISSAKDETGQTLATRLKNVPGFYDAWIKGMWAAGILAILLLSAVIFLSRPRRSGIRRAAKICLTVGVSSALFAWFSYFLINKFAESLAKSGDSALSLQATLIKLIRILAQDMRWWWLGYALILAVLGIGTLVALKILAQKEEQVSPKQLPVMDTPTHQQVKTNEKKSNM